MMGNGKWKKALLPSLGSLRRDSRSVARPARPLASSTDFEISSTKSAETHDNDAEIPVTAMDVEDRLVSELLETTAETAINSGGSVCRFPAQSRHLTRSHTVSAMSSNDGSGLALPSQTSQDPGIYIPSIPHKSSRRNMQGGADELLESSPGRSQDGLVRPMPTSHSVSSHFTSRGTRRVTQSSSSTAGNTLSFQYKGDSPIRKRSNSPRKICHSVTSVLVSSEDYTHTNPDGQLKTSRSKAKNVFAKFADVLAEHFTAKGSRKGDRSTETVQTATMGINTTEQQTVPSQRPTGLTLSPLLLSIQDTTDLRPNFLVEESGIKKDKAKVVCGRVEAGSTIARKRLTRVEEVDFHNSQPLEDPFSESSPGKNTGGFEARLKSTQGTRGGQTPTDPFQAERILESSVEAMLTTPPVGCSTPRRRPLSFSRCENPSQGSRKRGYAADANYVSPNMSPVDPERRRNSSVLRGGLQRGNQSIRDSRNRSLAVRANSRPANITSSDPTRLSSYPPGSTIRHVPRSMGRLKEAATLPMPASERPKGLSLRKKKHPSPSKGQLELFGQYMEKNLTLGVFKDADELGMSFNSPQLGTNTLSPRDTNHLMRNMTDSNMTLSKGQQAHGDHATLSHSRTRIPQPVRQLSRSRTDTAFARDFIPINKGDSTMGDELQWDASAYKIGHRCNHCGSTNQIV